MLPIRPDCHLVLHHNGKSTPINRNVNARLSANALTCYALDTKEIKTPPKRGFAPFAILAKYQISVKYGSFCSVLQVS